MGNEELKKDYVAVYDIDNNMHIVNINHIVSLDEIKGTYDQKIGKETIHIVNPDKYRVTFVNGDFIFLNLKEYSKLKERLKND